MAKKKIKIKWHKDASLHFEELLEHLFSESEHAASIVGNAILDEVDKLAYIHIGPVRKDVRSHFRTRHYLHIGRMALDRDK